MSNIVTNSEVDAFLEAFDSSTPDNLGDARLSSSERENLRQLRVNSNSHYDFVDALWQDGYPIPSEINAKDIGETAARHGCIVAENLLISRGKDAYSITYWSYTVKNAADRQITWMLRKQNMSDEFWRDWYKSSQRDPLHNNPKVKYPKNIDDTRIYGIANVHRYWSAQLLRYMEAARLGKITDQEYQKLKLENTDPLIYQLDWRDSWLEDALRDVHEVSDVPVNIALKVISVLRSRGLGDDQLTALISTGFSPTGPMLEHGFIDEVKDIWVKLLEKIALGDPLYCLLLERSTKSIINARSF